MSFDYINTPTKSPVSQTPASVRYPKNTRLELDDRS